jgi:predicted HAD superfamily Cof-like phosphohydrolase
MGANEMTHLGMIIEDLERLVFEAELDGNLMYDIENFHYKFGHERPLKPKMLDPDTEAFRIKFMHEELAEYMAAQTLEDKFDALIDLAYVVLGTAYMHGFNFNAGWKRVHEANMRKVRANNASDSKRGSALDVIKPDGWQAPDLGDLV